MGKKQIRSKARAILVEWIKEVIKKEDHPKVTRKNLEKLIENSSYYWSDGTLKLQPWSYKWIVKSCTKKKAPVKVPCCCLVWGGVNSFSPFLFIFFTFS